MAFRYLQLQIKFCYTNEKTQIHRRKRSIYLANWRTTFCPHNFYAYSLDISYVYLSLLPSLCLMPQPSTASRCSLKGMHCLPQYFVNCLFIYYLSYLTELLEGDDYVFSCWYSALSDPL